MIIPISYFPIICPSPRLSSSIPQAGGLLPYCPVARDQSIMAHIDLPTYHQRLPWDVSMSHPPCALPRTHSRCLCFIIPPFTQESNVPILTYTQIDPVLNFHAFVDHLRPALNTLLGWYGFCTDEPTTSPTTSVRPTSYLALLVPPPFSTDVSHSGTQCPDRLTLPEFTGHTLTYPTHPERYPTMSALHPILNVDIFREKSMDLDVIPPPP